MPRDIAIVGIGGIFPGAENVGFVGPDGLWDAVRSGRDVAREPPAGRWLLDPDSVHVPGGPHADRVVSKRGCFVDGFTLDPRGLEIDPELLRSLDPSVQLALHAAREAFEGAVTDGVDRSRFGVVLGNIALPTEGASALARDLIGRPFEESLTGRAPQSPAEGHALNRYVAGLPAGAVARALGLGGGHFALDAACASSLYALHLACEELAAGRTDAMLAGGLSRPDALYTQMGFSQLRALSPSGRCSPFDERGDGLVVGEGAAIFVLKRVADAVAAGDTIHGVIRGIGLSNDVEGNLLAPSSEGQLRAMRAAYDDAGWRPSDVDLVECHATGTPVGDATELATLRELWGAEDAAPGDCVIGGVKSNVGHLLTGAAAVGVTKVLFALRHDELPPTANFERPSAVGALDGSPFRVLRAPERWVPRSEGAPRRAAVSAFGFGGINAHVLIEEWTGSAVGVASTAEPPRVAIVGVGARAGHCDGERAVSRQLLGGGAAAEGSGLDAIEVAIGRFRIPPTELAAMLPQQLLLLDAADRAIADAGMHVAPRERAPNTRSGVFVGMSLDLNTTNFHMRWWAEARARAWARELARDLTEAELSAWVDELKDALSPPLTADRTLGALGGVVASRVAREFRFGGASYGISSEESSGLRAFALGVRALERGDLDTAVVGGVDVQTDIRASTAARAAGRLSGRPADAAVAFVLKRLEDAERDGDRVLAIVSDVACAGGGGLDVAPDAHARVAAPDAFDFSVVGQRVGDAGAAGGMLSLLGAVSAVRDGVLPRGIGDETTAHAIRPWLRDAAVDGPRRAHVVADGVDGSVVGVAIEEAQAVPRVAPAVEPPVALFVVGGATAADVLQSLDALAARPSTSSIHAHAVGWRHEHSRRRGDVACALVARDADDLRERIVEARGLIAGDSTPRPRARVFWSDAPLARDGEVAFVFPGSGTQFQGMGRDLLTWFPAVVSAQDAATPNLRSQVRPDRFWTRDAPPAPETDQRALIQGQVALGTLVSDVVRAFGVEPRAVLGYSLGETAGLFSLGAWTDREAMWRRVEESALFVSELSGACSAARAQWDIGEDQPFAWSIGVVDRPAAVVRDALAGRERVALLIVNTDDECVIGGRSDDVDAAVAELGATFVALEGVTTVHCDAVEPVRDAYHALHVFDEVRNPSDVRFYSCASGEPYDVTTTSGADSILDNALHGFDFPKLVRRAHEDGARIFVELGPGNSCTRMIRSILGDRSHVATAVCVDGRDALETLLVALGTLVAHGVDVDLGCLYDEASDVPPPGSSPVVVPLRRTASPAPQPPATEPAPPAAPVVADPLVAAFSSAATARARAHEAYLGASATFERAATANLAFQTQLAAAGAIPAAHAAPAVSAAVAVPARDIAFDRDQCLEFATGRIGAVLGPRWAEVDTFPTRVRLPDEPLMLVDRIVSIEGEAMSMSSGRIVTEHDVLPGDWYLDHDRIPTAIAIESGQADLFLSAHLGADFESKGLAVYRLLDAAVTFHGPLPRPGDVISYDIRIQRFFRQGDTVLFRFGFDGSVDGRPILSMTDGCAGFFSEAELAAGQGVVLTERDRQPMPGRRPDDWRELAPFEPCALDESQVDALRSGDLAAAFGDAFDGLPLRAPAQLPGDRMRLVHRVPELDPSGGRYGLGLVRTEIDIHPDDWFLTCHFVDDMVMPGTLMYECSLHALRVFVARLGWVGESDRIAYEPVPGVASKLRCRGQITATTRISSYEVHVKEIGYGPEPYALADALMYADGRLVVQMIDMSMRITGTTRDEIERLWSERTPTVRLPAFERSGILAFADGRPSDAFGPRYARFDDGAFVARLPRPPYLYLDRVLSASLPPFELRAGGVTVSEWRVPELDADDAWFFRDSRSGALPFGVLLEVALQTCGWTSAYMGSSLASDGPLHYRNLGGAAVVHRNVRAGGGLLRTRIECTDASRVGDMLIQEFAFAVSDADGPVYEGRSNFGFFTPKSLSEQAGIRGGALALATGDTFPVPVDAPFATGRWRFIEEIEAFDPAGGPDGLGYVRGAIDVDPDSWFFEAHFRDDPVWPGSLGLESLVQALEVAAARALDLAGDTEFASPAPGVEHAWTYRGQVLPTARRVTVEVNVTAIDAATGVVTGDGLLAADGAVIYSATGLSVQANAPARS